MLEALYKPWEAFTHFIKGDSGVRDVRRSRWGCRKLGQTTFRYLRYFKRRPHEQQCGEDARR